MNKKSLFVTIRTGILSVCSLCLLLSSCDTFQDIEVVSRGDSRWVMPIAHAEISVMDLLKNRNPNNLFREEDDQVLLSYTIPSEFRFKIKDLLTLPDLQFDLQGRIPKNGYPNDVVIPTGQLAALQALLPAVSGEFACLLPHEITDFNRFAISINCHLKIENNPTKTDYRISFPDLKDAEGNPISLQVTASGASFEENIRLEHIAFPPSSGNKIQLRYTITPQIKEIPSVISIKQGESIRFSLSLSRPEFIHFEGKTQPIPQTFFWKTSDFTEVLMPGLQGIRLQNSQLLLNVESQDINLPFRIEVDYKAQTPQGEVQKSIVRNGLWIDSSAGERQTISLEGEDIAEFISLAMSYPLEAEFRGIIHSNTKPLYITNQSETQVRGTLNQPLSFALSNYEVKAIVPGIDLSALRRVQDLAGDVALKIHSYSTLPLEMECQEMNLLDKEGHLLDQGKISVDGVLLGSTDGIMVREGALMIRLPKEQLSALQNAHKIEMVLVARTTDQKMVKLMPNQKIRIAVTLSMNQKL